MYAVLRDEGFNNSFYALRFLWLCLYADWSLVFEKKQALLKFLHSFYGKSEVYVRWTCFLILHLSTGVKISNEGESAPLSFLEGQNDI